jgi:hypothetical protein
MAAPGPAPAGGSGGQGPSPPTHRPRWLLILSSITLLYGGLTLVSGLTALRNPASAARFPVTRPMAPEEEALTNELMAVSTEIVARHAGAIRGRAAASMVLALLMLYSAAAALSRDRHGRRATLITAWLGIIYQVGTLPLVIPIANDYAAVSAPILIRMVAAAEGPVASGDAGAAGNAGAGSGAIAGAASDATGDAGGTATAATAGTTPSSAPDRGDPPPRPEALTGFTQTVFLGIPILTALLGVAGSLLMIRYFGGPRGRALYGLPPRR